jgi:hypothetical protein
MSLLRFAPPSAPNIVFNNVKRYRAGRYIALEFHSRDKSVYYGEQQQEQPAMVHHNTTGDTNYSGRGLLPYRLWS